MNEDWKICKLNPNRNQSSQLPNCVCVSYSFTSYFPSSFISIVLAPKWLLCTAGCIWKSTKIIPLFLCIPFSSSLAIFHYLSYFLNISSLQSSLSLKLSAPLFSRTVLIPSVSAHLPNKDALQLKSIWTIKTSSSLFFLS